MVEILKSEDELLWKGRANSWEIEYSNFKGFREVEVKAGDAFDADFAETIQTAHNT
jgi:molecular chaperone GrpE